MVIQLISVPILLHAWGTGLYGEWLILFAIPAYLSMTDLGFSLSAANDMTARVSCGDRREALSVFQTLGILVFFATTVGFVLVSALLITLPINRWSSFHVMGTSEIRWILWFLAAEVLARLPDGITHAGFRANGEYAFHVKHSSTIRLVQFAVIWVTALMGGGPVTSSAAFFFVRAMATLKLALILHQRHPWLQHGIRYAKGTELRRLFKPALANMAIPLAQSLNIQGMVLVVGNILGPLAVVTFSTLRTLSRLVLQLVYAVSHATEPEFAVAFGTGNHTLMKSLFVNAIRAGLWLSLAAAAGLFVFGTPILGFWTHGKVAMDRGIYILLLSSAVASVLWHASMVLLKAANRHAGVTLVLVLSSGAAIAISTILLLWTEALATAAVALLLMDGVMALYTMRSVNNIIGMRYGSSFVLAANPFPLLRLVRGRSHEI